MEFERFEEIRDRFCREHSGVSPGKMMSSPAIHYEHKVFAFFSRKNKMVFKLGKAYPLEGLDFEIMQFSPFKTKKPLSGWFEVGHSHHDQWERLALEALKSIKGE